MADLAVLSSLAGWRPSLRSGRIRKGAVAGLGALGLSVFLLFALGLVIAANQSALRARFGWIQHTDDVLLQVASLQQELQRMESDMRGYGLSGDPGHIASWSQLKTDSDARLARLAQMMADNPAQGARLAAIRPLITGWAARWSVFAAHPSPAMLPALRAGLARDLREHPGRRFHGGLNAIAGVERMLLKQREETAARLTTALEWLSVLLALAAPTVGMVGIFLLLREGEHVRQRELQMQLEHSQRLRSFIQKHDTQWQPETCASLVADAVALLGSIDARVALNTDVQTGLPVVMVDRIQIQQVLVNLMRNAIEAMAASPRREMWLTVARADDGRVLFRLRDSGPGLAPQVAQRLFQPFTSTKEEGMGIGLSICRRILHDHGGDIWVESPADGGAAFCFALPVRA